MHVWLLADRCCLGRPALELRLRSAVGAGWHTRLALVPILAFVDSGRTSGSSWLRHTPVPSHVRLPQAHEHRDHLSESRRCSQILEMKTDEPPPPGNAPTPVSLRL